MEPRILLIGRLQSTIDVLSIELKRMGRQVVASNKIEEILQILERKEADLVVMGAGLEESVRNSMIMEMKGVDGQIPIYPLERGPEATPVKLLHLANEKAIMTKIHLAAGIKPISKE